MNFSEFTANTIKEVLSLTETSEFGLSNQEAQRRLKIYGSNEIRSNEVGFFDILKRQFKNSFIYLLFVAAIIASLVGEINDGAVIFAFIFVNVFLGFIQEARAHRAILLLKKYLPFKARVLREGKEAVIDKESLVLGDIVLLEAGNVVPADLRVLSTENFLVNESVLTGESASVSKIFSPLKKKAAEIFDAKNILFSGTSVVLGKAKAVVVATAKDAAFGEITKMAMEAKKESIYEKEVAGFSKTILKTVILAIIFIFLGNIIIKGTYNLFDFLIFCLALIVSIIPEALPLVVTFALSKGALLLTKKKVVVKRLAAIEDMGNIEVLCIDKTGTITENKLKLDDIYSKNRDKCIFYGLLSSSYVLEKIESSVNPFDYAIFEAADVKTKNSIKKYKTISEIAFDSRRMRNSVILEGKNKKRLLIVKGAPESILKISKEIEGGALKTAIKKEISKQGKNGKRVLAVAYKELDEAHYSSKEEKNLTFLGYFTFSDPLKKGAKEAILKTKKMGVAVKIITGDSREVAANIAQAIGLIESDKDVIRGDELNSLPAGKFLEMCEKFAVFSRISPQIKHKIVQALGAKYEVGFLGDGINDAPALKAAHVGITVENASDVSKDVADIILLKKDLRVIVDGIAEGRNIFSNINKYIKCALASNFGNFYSIAIISLFVNYLPMLPIQILLGNLLSDFPLVSITTDHVDIEELKKPKLYKLSKSIPLIILLASVSTIFDFIFFSIFFKSQPATIQTLWFIESILTEIVLIFCIRTRGFFFKAMRPSYALIGLTIFDAIFIVILPFTYLGQGYFHFVSVPLNLLFTVFFLVANYFIASEAVKIIYFKFFAPKLERSSILQKAEIC